MGACWEHRGCDEEMMSRCPHNLGGDFCPGDCWNASCQLPTHVVVSDFALLLSPDVDFEAAPKRVCHFCEHFLKNGPRK